MASLQTSNQALKTQCPEEVLGDFPVALPHSERYVAMTNSAEITFVPCPEGVERDDPISCGEGKCSRTFRSPVEGRTALHQAAIATEQIETSIDSLDDGVSLMVPVTEHQHAAFYGSPKEEG